MCGGIDLSYAPIVLPARPPAIQPGPAPPRLAPHAHQPNPVREQHRVLPQWLLNAACGIPRQLLLRRDVRCGEDGGSALPERTILSTRGGDTVPGGSVWRKRGFEGRLMLWSMSSRYNARWAGGAEMVRARLFMGVCHVAGRSPGERWSRAFAAHK